MDEDEQLRQALEESLRTARAEDELRTHEASAPTAPLLIQADDMAAANSQEPVSDFERQRREAMMRQATRWQQLHGQQGSGHSTHQHQQPLQGGETHSLSSYPPVPAPDDRAGLAGAYPSIPRYIDDSPAGIPESSLHSPTWSSTNQQQQPPAHDEPEDPVLERLRRKQQQEEEDHRLALQLAAQFETEDSENEQMHLDEAATAAHQHTPSAYVRPGGPDGEDSDWQQVNRTPSMQQTAAAGPDPSTATAPGSTHSSSRPSSQAAAAAGSAAGGLLGAGVAALLAMAANAAARRAQQAQESTAHASAGSEGSQQQQHYATTSSSTGNPQQYSAHSSNEGRTAPAAAGEDASSSQGSRLPGMLGMAANALWSYMTGRQSSESSSTATAAASTSSSSSSSAQQQRQQQAAGQDADMRVLQQLMQHLMTGQAPNHQQTRGSRGQGQGGGFRVVNLPGGGFAATYSTSNGSNRQQHRAAASAADDPFAMYMDPTEDLFSQLLLAGARSARSNHHRQQGLGNQDPMEAGFTHFDPVTGRSRFEPMDQVFGPGFMGPGLRGGSDQGLEALLGALLGGQGFEGQFGGPGGMRYEDLVNLDNVHVSTPDEVLAQLPRSKFVEGRKPGDSDICVICQTQYSPGDSLIHLPCLHAFHEDCVTPWLQGHSKKCPVCKTDVC